MQEETKVNRPSPVTEWAQICSKSMRDHLAPKGFAEIRSGVYRGKKKSNIDYLSKEMVDASGKIAFGCVNHYKNRLKDHLKSEISHRTKTIDSFISEAGLLKFFQYRKRRSINDSINSLDTQRAVIMHILDDLDKITVQ